MRLIPGEFFYFLFFFGSPIYVPVCTYGEMQGQMQVLIVLHIIDGSRPTWVIMVRRPWA